MRKLVGRSILLTVLIISLIIIISNSIVKDVNPEIRLLIYIIAGILLVAITLMIVGMRPREKKEPKDKSHTGKLD